MNKNAGSNVMKDSRSVGYNVYLDEDGFNRLKTFLGRILEGQDKVYTAPFAKGMSMEEILHDWFKTLVSIKDKWPTLYEFEEDLANKVGPLSVQLPVMDRLKDIEHYYDDICLSSEPINEAAIKAVINEFSSVRTLDVRAQAATVDNMKKSTSSGTPLMTKRRKVIQETIPLKLWTTKGRVQDAIVSYPIGEYDGAAVLGWRGQEGGPDSKTVNKGVF
jgi:hypothetical protein